MNFIFLKNYNFSILLLIILMIIEKILKNIFFDQMTHDKGICTYGRIFKLNDSILINFLEIFESVF